jgi:hypothetical protein
MNSLERTGARDTLERFSLAIEQLGPILAAVLMIPSAILVAGAGGYAGWALAQGNPRPLPFEALRFLLLAACGLTIIGPLLLPAGERTNAVRLLLLPISRPVLYAAQAATTLTDPWVALAVPAVLALPMGLAIGGAWGASLVAAGAGVLLVLTLVGITTLASSLIHLIVRDRRRGELITLAFILILPIVGLLPSLMAGASVERQAARRAGRPRPTPAWIVTLERRALPVVPSEMFVRSTRAAAQGQPDNTWRPLAGLVVTAGALHAAGLFVFGRLLDSPGSVGSRRKTAGARARPLKIPGVSRAISAIALNQIRLALRTPRGRSILLSPLVVFMMFGLMMWNTGGLAEFGFLRLQSGLALAVFGSWMSLMVSIPISMNQFSIDRAGLTMVFYSPLDDWELLRGKAIGNGLIAGIPAIVCIVGAATIFRNGPIALWLSLPFAIVATCLLVAPPAAALSALFPRPVELNSIGRGSNAHGAAGFLGFIAITAAGAVTAAVALLAMRALPQAHWAPLIMLIWCAVCAVAARLLFVPVRLLFARRRENLALIR